MLATPFDCPNLPTAKRAFLIPSISVITAQSSLLFEHCKWLFKVHLCQQYSSPRILQLTCDLISVPSRHTYRCIYQISCQSGSIDNIQVEILVFGANTSVMEYEGTGPDGHLDALLRSLRRPMDGASSMARWPHEVMSAGASSMACRPYEIMSTRATPRYREEATMYPQRRPYANVSSKCVNNNFI